MTIKIEVEDISELYQLLSSMSVAPEPVVVEPPVSEYPQGTFTSPECPGVTIDFEKTDAFVVTPPEPEGFDVQPELPGATVDANGDEWDERIHSRGKTFNQDGTWRIKRKPNDIDESEWQTYIDQIRQPNSVPEPQILKPIDEEITFPQLMAVITEKITSGSASTEEIDSMIYKHDINNVAELLNSDKTHLIPVIYAELSQ